MLRESSVAYSSLPQEEGTSSRSAPAFVTTRNAPTPHARRDCQLTTLIMALVVLCGVTLAVVLPLALKHNAEAAGREEAEIDLNSLSSLKGSGGEEKLPGDHISGTHETEGIDNSGSSRNNTDDLSGSKTDGDGTGSLPPVHKDKTTTEPPHPVIKTTTTTPAPLYPTFVFTTAPNPPTFRPYYPPVTSKPSPPPPETKKPTQKVTTSAPKEDPNGSNVSTGDSSDTKGVTGESKGVTENVKGVTEESKDVTNSGLGDDKEGNHDKEDITTELTYSTGKPSIGATNSSKVDNIDQAPGTNDTAVKPTTTQSFSGWMNELLSGHDEATLVVLVVLVAVAVTAVVLAVVWFVHKKLSSRRRRINIQSVITDLQSRDKVVLLNSEDSEDEQ